MKAKLFLILAIVFAFAFQSFKCNEPVIKEQPVELQTQNGTIYGTLTVTESNEKMPVVLIIAGSGPTDRDGNNPYMKNNSLKMTATKLAENNIASLRYDKRGIAASKEAGKNEADLRFDDYVNDAKLWIDFLKKDNRFSEIIILGHSEGSLIGMIAAQDADKFISVAGAGQSADKILKTQLSNQPKEIQDASFPIIDSLKNGKLAAITNPQLFALFRPTVQPYLISWFKFDPVVEIAKLNIPVLILQGTNDIQISTEDADLLAKANQKSKTVLIKNMNHILKICEGDRNANIKTYSNSELPLAEEFVINLIDFIDKK